MSMTIPNCLSRTAILLFALGLAAAQVSCPAPAPQEPAESSAPAVTTAPGDPTGPTATPAPTPNPAPAPTVGPAISQVTFDRSAGGGSTLGIRDTSASDHSYSYTAPGDGDAGLGVSTIPGAEWNDNGALPDTVTLALATKTPVAVNLAATNLQLVGLRRGTGEFTVLFEPFGSTVAGDEVTVTFDATRYEHAKRLSLALRAAEAAPSRLALSQPAGSTTLAVSYGLN